MKSDVVRFALWLVRAACCSSGSDAAPCTQTEYLSPIVAPQSTFVPCKLTAMTPTPVGNATRLAPRLWKALRCCVLVLTLWVSFNDQVQAAKVDKKRSIALPVKAVKRDQQGPSYLTKLRSMNVKEFTLACSACRLFTALVKTRVEVNKDKNDYQTVDKWRMDERQKNNYYKSDSHLLDIFDDQVVCNSLVVPEKMQQCHVDESVLCVDDVPTSSDRWIGRFQSACREFVEMEEETLTHHFIRSKFFDAPNGDFEFCKTLHACKGRAPPVKTSKKGASTKNKKKKGNKKKKTKQTDL